MFRRTEEVHCNYAEKRKSWFCWGWFCQFAYSLHDVFLHARETIKVEREAGNVPPGTLT